MAGTPNAGFAVLQVIPSVRGISDELRRQLVGPAGDAGDRAGQAAGAGLKDKFKAGAAAAGVAAGAVLVAGITEAIDQANITSTLQAQLGTTGKVAAKHGKIAGKLYSTGVSGSFQGAADAIKAVVQAGLAPPGATNKQLQSMATKATDVATVFGQDLGGTANAVGNMIKSGLARNADEAFDILTAGLQRGADKGGDLVDTFAESSLNLKQFGFDAESAMGFLVQGMNAGAPSADALTGALEELIGNAGDSADVFASMGLNGKQMAADLSGGGPKAAKALDTLLDRFRGMKDPAQRSTALVSLFGEEATAMQGAILALDPSEASKAMGTFAGSAKGLGDTLRSGPSYEIQKFTRALKQGFIDFLGGKVLPIITQAGQFFNTYLLPPIRTVASVLAATLVPALAGLVRGGRSVVDWLRDMGTWLIPIGIALGGFALALSANAIAIGLVTVAMRIAGGVAKVWTAITKAATIAHAALNLVMRANPIILVITAIVALVAALIVAYKKSETFRAIVQGAFNGVLAVGKAIGAWFSGPFVRFFTETIPDAFRTVLNWVKANWPWLLGALTGPIGLAVVWIIKNWDRVRAFFVEAWQAIVRNVLTPIRTFFTSTIPGWARTVRDRVVSAWGTLRDRVHGAYVWVRDHVFSPLRTFFTSTIPGWAGTVRDRVAGAFGTLRDRVHGAYTWIRDHVFYKLRDFFKSTIPGWAGDMKNKVVEFFRKMKDGLGEQWDKIKSKAKAPINWVIRHVWNNGIVSVWKKITGWIGLDDKLGTIKELAAGGTVGAGFGQPATPGIFNRPTAIVGEGRRAYPEFVIPTDPRYRSRALSLYQAAGTQLMADGGVIGFVKGAAKKVGGAVKSAGQFLVDPIGSAKKLFAPFLDKLDEIRDSSFGRMVAKFPGMAVNGLVNLVKKAASSLGGAIGLGDSSVRGSAQQYAQLYMKTLGWGPSQWPALKALWQAESGWNPLAHNKSSGAHGIPQSLPASKMRSEGADYWTNPATQIRWGLKYIKGRYGSPNAAWSFWQRQSPHWYDEGGVIPPGLHSVYNGTRRPERVLTDRQWDALFQAARGGDGGGDIYNFYPRTLDMTVRDLDTLQRRRDAASRVGRPR